MSKKVKNQLNEASQVVVVGESPPMLNKDSKKKLIVVIGGLVLLVIVFGLTVTVLKRSNKPAGSVAVCSDELLNQAAPLLEEKKYKELEPIARQIEGLKNYDKDPNCLFVVTTYYINVTDAKNARLNYDKLMLIYTPETQLQPAIAAKVRSPYTMRSSIEFLEEQQRKFEEGKIQGGRNGP